MPRRLAEVRQDSRGVLGHVTTMTHDWYADHGGDGQLLVLLHGGTRTRADWADCAALLRTSFRVAALDLRGHGQRVAERFQIAGSLDDVDALIDALGYTAAVIVGHSIGGIVATAYAADRRRAVGVVNVDGIGVSLPAALRDSPRALQNVVALIEEMDAVVGDSEPEASLAQAVAAADVFELTRRTRVPCLVVLATGAHGRAAAAMEAWRDAAMVEFERISTGNKHVSVETLPSSHFVPLERPTDLTELITRWFLERVHPPR